MIHSFTKKEILEASQAINHLTMQNVPQKTAYRLAKLAQKIRSLAKDIDKDRLKLYKVWGKEKTQGKGDFSVAEEKMPEFLTELDKMLGVTVEVDFHPVACNQFKEIQAEAILGMGAFMVEEELITLAPR